MSQLVCAGLTAWIILAAGPGLAEAEEPIPPALESRAPRPAVALPVPAARITQATLTVKLERNVAVCRYGLRLDSLEEDPPPLFLPVPAGRLATQDSASGTTVTKHRRASRAHEGGPAVCRIDLPGPGRHRVRFALHVPAHLEDGIHQVRVHHPGAVMSHVRIRSSRAVRVDRSSLQPLVSRDDGFEFSLAPGSEPLPLRWWIAPQTTLASLPQQESRLDFTIHESEVTGVLRVKVSSRSPLPNREFHLDLPPSSLVESVHSESLHSWRAYNGRLRLSLKPDPGPPHHLTIRTSTPLRTDESPLRLPLPSLHPAAPARGTLSIRNASSHHLGDVQVPSGFSPLEPPDSPPDSRSSGEPGLRYRFVSLRGEEAKISLSRPRARLITRIATQVSLNRERAEIIREIRLTPKFAPVFETRFRLPGDETITDVRILRGSPEMRNHPGASPLLRWSHGFVPGETTRLEIVSRKALPWQDDRTSLSLRLPELSSDELSGTLAIRAEPGLAFWTDGTPGLQAVASPEVPAGFAAAWTHTGFDVLELRVERERVIPSIRSRIRVAPAPTGTRIRGTLQLSPGTEPVSRLRLRLAHAQLSQLRLPSERFAARRFRPSTNDVVVSLSEAATAPLTIPWQVLLPASSAAAPGDRKSLAKPFAVPRLFLPGATLEEETVRIVRQPFATYSFHPEGFERVPLAKAQSARTAKPPPLAAAFRTSSESALLEVAVLDPGGPAAHPWRIPTMLFRSEILTPAPNRHHCTIRVAPHPTERHFPLELPRDAELEAFSCDGKPFRPLRSTRIPNGLLVPVHPGNTPRTIELTYRSPAYSWGPEGEETIRPVRIPETAVIDSSDWFVVLPDQYDYFEPVSNLVPAADDPSLQAAAGPGTASPPDLANHRSSSQPSTAASSPAASSGPSLHFHGTYAPEFIRFHYLHWRRHLATALILVLTGGIAFWILGRDKPVIIGLFGVLLLAFLPRSGIPPMHTLSQSLLVGWLGGIGLWAAIRLRRLLRRASFTGRAPARILGLLGAVALTAVEARSASEEPRFPQATHHLTVSPNALLAVSEYTTKAGSRQGSRIPFSWPDTQVENLSLNGSPVPSGSDMLTLPGSGPHTIRAEYRVPLPLPTSGTTWKIPPARAATVILSGPEPPADLKLNGGLPAVLRADGSLAFALGDAHSIGLRFASRETIPRSLPDEARIRSCLAVWPSLQKLFLEVEFRHPGRARRDYTILAPAPFQIAELPDSDAWVLVRNQRGDEHQRLHFRARTRQRDRSKISLVLEHSEPGSSSRFPLPRIQASADVTRQTVTLATIPSLRVRFRDAAGFSSAPPFPLPRSLDWLRTGPSVHLPETDRELQIQVQPSQEPRRLSRRQLYLLTDESPRAFCLASFPSPPGRPGTTFRLPPDVRVSSVSGSSLTGWRQRAGHLDLKQKPGARTGSHVLVTFEWPKSSPGSGLPFPLLSSPRYSLESSRTAVATSPRLSFSEPLSGSSPDAPRLDPSPFSVSEPLQMRAVFDDRETTEPLRRTLQEAPSRLLCDTIHFATVNRRAVRLVLHLRVAPVSSPLRQLVVEVPDRVPPITWKGDHLRQARFRHTAGFDVYTLDFTGPVHEAPTFAGTVSIPFDGGRLRLPMMHVRSATEKNRFMVADPSSPSSPSGLTLHAQGMTAIGPDSLPINRGWPSGARFFTASTADATLAFAPDEASNVLAPASPAVADLSIDSSLQRNGESTHRARFLLVPPSGPVLHLDLPPGCSLLGATINQSSVPLRAGGTTDSGDHRTLIAIPDSLPRSLPCILEALYHCHRPGPHAEDEARTRYSLHAPALAELPVAQTSWKVRAPPGVRLRESGGNLYELDEVSFRQNRLQTRVEEAERLWEQFRNDELPRGLQRSALTHLRLLTSQRVPHETVSPARDAASQEKPHPTLRARLLELDSLAEEELAALPEPPAAPADPPLFRTGAATKGNGHSGASDPSPDASRHGQPGPGSSRIPLAPHVFLDAEAVPWLDPAVDVPWTGFSSRLSASSPDPPTPEPTPDSASVPAIPGEETKEPNDSGPAPAESGMPHGKPAGGEDPLGEVAYFRKLKGNAQLELAISQPVSRSLLVNWLVFAGAVLALLGLNHVCTQRRPAPSSGRRNEDHSSGSKFGKSSSS